MTAQELIVELQKYPIDAQILVEIASYHCDEYPYSRSDLKAVSAVDIYHPGKYIYLTLNPSIIEANDGFVETEE